MEMKSSQQTEVFRIYGVIYRRYATVYDQFLGERDDGVNHY